MGMPFPTGLGMLGKKSFRRACVGLGRLTRRPACWVRRRPIFLAIYIGLKATLIIGGACYVAASFSLASLPRSIQHGQMIRAFPPPMADRGHCARRSPELGSLTLPARIQDFPVQHPLVDGDHFCRSAPWFLSASSSASVKEVFAPHHRLVDAETLVDVIDAALQDAFALRIGNA